MRGETVRDELHSDEMVVLALREYVVSVWISMSEVDGTALDCRRR
jgi:hypothetical protein